MRDLIVGIVYLIVINCVVTIIIPEGKMKSFSLSMIGVLMFINIACSILEFFSVI